MMVGLPSRRLSWIALDPRSCHQCVNAAAITDCLVLVRPAASLEAPPGVLCISCVPSCVVFYVFGVSWPRLYGVSRLTRIFRLHLTRIPFLRLFHAASILSIPTYLRHDLAREGRLNSWSVSSVSSNVAHVAEWGA